MTTASEESIAALAAQLAEAEVAGTPKARFDPVCSLPPELVERIFLDVPLDDRLRGREVCSGWRAFLGRPRLWEVLDFSRLALRTPALLAAAAACAQGSLRVLDLTGWDELVEEDEEEDEETALKHVLPVLRSNARSLLELRVGSLSDSYWFSTAHVDELLAAAPLLRVLECDVDLGFDNEASLQCRACW